MSAKNKKILIVNTRYRELGGEDINILDEISFLKKNYIVSYLEFNNNEKLKFRDLIYFFTLNNFDSNQKLQFKIDSFKPDLIYINNTWFKGNLGLFKIIKKNKIKTILKIHNFRYLCTRHISAKKHINGNSSCNMCGRSFSKFAIFNKYFSNSYLKSIGVLRYGLEYIKIIKNYPINIFVLNNFHKQFLINLGIEQERVKISYNPIKISNEIISSSNSNYVTYAGRISEEKGLNELLETWTSAKVDNLILKIVGDGNLLDSLKSKYTNDNVEFLGEKSQEETLEIIKNSRAVITSTKMYEGQPRLLCEASSFGIPSIFPNFGGLKEYFPEEYPLSFEQFDYDNLKEKIYLLQDSVLVKNQGFEVHSHLKSILKDKKLIYNFEEALKN